MIREPSCVGPSRVLVLTEDGCAATPKNLNDRQGGRPNLISTARFTLLSWLPKSLYSQFKRVANLYFLFISVIVCFHWSPIMWQSTVIPFVCVLLWTALKDMYEDFRRRRDDDAENLRSCLRFDWASWGFLPVRWCDILCGDILLSLQDEQIPADVLLLRTNHGTAFISTVNLDGETNLKERHAADLLSAMLEQVAPLEEQQLDGAEPELPYVSFSSQRKGTQDSAPVAALAPYTSKIVKLLTEQGFEAQLEEPKPGLTDMDGLVQLNRPTATTEAALRKCGVQVPCPVRYEHFVPRGCVLRNTKYMVSMVAYAGPETKTQLNVASTDAKISNMQMYLNRGVKGLIAALVVFCLYAALSAEATGNKYWDSWGTLKVHPGFLWKYFLFYVIIMYQVVPVSLYVCFEIIKLILGMRINLDPLMMDPETNRPALARTADLVEEMGQVDFIFSDKTGTLTENQMLFAACCIEGQDMGDFRTDEAHSKDICVADSAGVATVKRLLRKSETMTAQDEAQRLQVRWFFLCLVTCHTGQVEIDKWNQARFSGSSPDEVAFLEAARAVGITFRARRRVPGESASELHINGPMGEGTHICKVLCEIPFTSERKRMTVILQFEGEIFCICKGADSVMGPMCADSFSSSSAQHLARYSELGLRTLAVASRPLEQAFFEDWRRRLQAAQGSGAQGREEAVAEVVAEMEQGLTLVGISAIEDRLQAGVPEAITTLKAAGIRFWVLTGDKTETAVEIVRACRLFTEDMSLAYMVNCKGSDHALELMEAAKHKLEDAKSGGLILDGTLLAYALGGDVHRRLLYQLAIQSQACVCCRLSPQQKRRLVELVREQNRLGITLAVGDGANDVSMIQGAHVGVGIRGKEGNQAVQASDVALSQFRFLVPLLLCHGRRAYRRVALYLCYCIYKHIVLATGDAIWMHQNRFEGSIAYPEWLSSAFPALLTALPIIAVVGFDRDLPDEVACRTPELYVEGVQKIHFNARIFIGWLVSAVWHGTLAWVLPRWLAANASAEQGEPAAFWIGSCCSFTVVIVYVNLRLWLISLNPCSKLVVGIFSLSFASLLATIFVLGESGLGLAMQPQIAGVPSVIFGQWKYLKVMFLSSLPLLLDFLVYQAFFYLAPTPLDIARRRLRKGYCVW